MRSTWQLSDCSHVQIAAYLTGVNRVDLRACWRAAGPSLCYGDTDSAYTTVESTYRRGAGLGEYGLDGIGLDFLCRGPKAYRFAHWYAELEDEHVERLARHGIEMVQDLTDGVWKAPARGMRVLSGAYEVRSKGVPLRDVVTWDAWAGAFDFKLEPGEYFVNRPRLANEGESVPLDAGVWGVKGGARRGEIFVARAISRAAKNSLKYAGSRAVLEDGSTRPLDFDEYEALVADEVI
jgi:hypothetical protein